MNHKLYSCYYDERDPFGIFPEVVAIGSLEQLKNDGVLVLWGGEDISPALYNQIPIKETSALSVPSRRDSFEVACALWAIENNMPIIGVCRGAQLMCALNGGTLIQHVTNHAGGKHEIETYDGIRLFTNSIHHQMMNPVNTEHEVLAWTPYPISTKYLGEHRQNLTIHQEPEIVWFPKTKTLAIQGHPEYLYPNHDFVKYCTTLIQRILLTGGPK